MYICMCVYVCMHVCVCMYACMCECMYVCVYVCVYVCMYVCMAHTSIGGGSMKSNVMRSLTPMALRERTVEARLVRWISGTAVGNISSR